MLILLLVQFSLLLLMGLEFLAAETAIRIAVDVAECRCIAHIAVLVFGLSTLLQAFGVGAIEFFLADLAIAVGIDAAEGQGSARRYGGSAAGTGVTARTSRVASAARANVKRFIMTDFPKKFGC